MIAFIRKMCYNSSVKERFYYEKGDVQNSMTTVELFDQIPVHNIISCLAFAPDKIIFLGEGKLIKKKLGIYETIAREKGLPTVFDFRSVNKNDLDSVVAVLSEIVEQEDQCSFDLTGGEDLVLVAMGIVYEKYRSTKPIQLHRFNVGTGSLADCDNDGNLPPVPGKLQLSVKDCVSLYGGAIIPYDGVYGTYEWHMDEELEQDVLSMWRMCQQNPGEWNPVVTTMTVLSEFYSMAEDPLCVFGSLYRVEEKMKSLQLPFSWTRPLIDKLRRFSLLLDYHEDDDTVAFRFKNEQVKMCLTRAGTILEMVVYYHALHAQGKDQTPRFSDAATGVVLDWDGVLHDDIATKQDTENEIDVILMKGLVPVFVSCKNGFVDEDELYKLHTVAERFGGPYAKKVLILTYSAKYSARSNHHFEQRARDLKIQLIENVAELDEAGFAREIRKIVC